MRILRNLGRRNSLADAMNRIRAHFITDIFKIAGRPHFRFVLTVEIMRFPHQIHMITILFQGFQKARVVLLQKVMNRPMTVGVRIPAGIKAAAAGNADRRLTKRIFEQNPFLGQRVVIRRRQLGIAQTAQTVRPQLVRNKKQTIFSFIPTKLSF